MPAYIEQAQNWLRKQKDTDVPADPLTPEEAAEINSLGPAPGTTLASMSNPSSAGRLAAMTPAERAQTQAGQPPPGAGIPRPATPFRMDETPGQSPMNPAELDFAKPVAPPQPVNVPAQNVPIVDPRLQAQIQAANLEQQNAIGERQAAARAQAQAESGIPDARAQGLVGEQAAMYTAQGETRRMADARQKHADALLNQIDQESRKLSEIKIDPDRLWNNASLFDQIRWTIGNVAGGFLQGFNGLQSNPAADQMERRIRADIDAQKADFEAKRGHVKDMESLYTRAYEATGDKDRAYHVALGMGLDMAKTETQALTANAESEVAKTRGDVLSAELEERKKQVAGQGVEKTMAMNKYVPAHQAIPGYGTLNKDQKKQADALHTQLATLDEQRAANSAYIEARKHPWDIGGLNAAHSRKVQADMNVMQAVHGIRATVAHQRPIEAATPGVFTVGGEGALEEQNRLSAEQRQKLIKYAQERGIPIPSSPTAGASGFTPAGAETDKEEE